MKPEFSPEDEEAGRAWIPYFVLAVTLLLTAVAVYFVARDDAATDHTPYVLAGGLLVSLILFWLARAQARARAAAESAAAKLGQSEVRFRTLIEQSPLSTQVFSPDGRTLQVNRAWEQLWGVTLETLGDYNVLKDEQLVEKGIMPYLERGFAGTPTQVPPILYDPEASIPHITTNEHPKRWVQALIYPVRDAAGEIREVVLVHEDITERKRVEETLRYQLNLTGAITTHTAEGLCLLDAEGRLTLMNPAAEAMLGWTEAELKGRVLHEAVHYLKPDGSPFPLSECPLVGVLARRETVANREDVWVRKDGTLLPIFCSCAPIVVDGKVTGAVLAAHDIAERKRAEDARAHLEAQLHRRAEQLAEANRVKDEFLATLSHELRTPLTSILGWAKLMRSESFDPQMSARALEMIERGALAQSQLINDLLDVSRIITGKLRLVAQALELAPIIAAAVDSLRPAADARGVRLEVQLDAATGQVSGDADRLQQVIWNLVSNAIKFTPKAGRVCVYLRREGSQAEIVVEDTGEGIGRDFLPYIFDRFRQADGSITREHGGLGLGLSIVRHIVELHGGRVRAESDGDGRGATFRATLPLIAPAPQPHDTPVADFAVDRDNC
jgi:PAS domain S-box-containing protein